LDSGAMAQCELVLTAPSRNILTYLLTYLLTYFAVYYYYFWCVCSSTGLMKMMMLTLIIISV